MLGMTIIWKSGSMLDLKNSWSPWTFTISAKYLIIAFKSPSFAFEAGTCPLMIIYQILLKNSFTYAPKSSLNLNVYMCTIFTTLDLHFTKAGGVCCPWGKFTSKMKKKIALTLWRFSSANLSGNSSCDKNDSMSEREEFMIWKRVSRAFRSPMFCWIKPMQV